MKAARRMQGMPASTLVALAALAVTSAHAADDKPVRMSIAGVCYDPAVSRQMPLLATGRFATMEDCLKAGRKAATPKAGADASTAAASTPAPMPVPAPTPASPRVERALFDTDDASLVKRGRDNRCLAAGQPGYAEAAHFRGYGSLQDCLDSGGLR